jgi:hypothetical protein
MLTMSASKKDLFRTDVDFKRINLNENFKIPNKYRKHDTKYED